ncbi:RRQRL motif-containing zinc-binding protein [Nocardia sp. NPDC004722]
MSAERGGDVPLYPWMAAPSHLKTRRQLSAQGRAPGRQDIAGRMETRRRGQIVVAYLFDIGKSTPKRTATPAQREALARANRERQIQAAERRGYTRFELTENWNSGPGWGTPSELDPHLVAAAELLHLCADAAHHTLARMHAPTDVLAALAGWRGPNPAADPAAYLTESATRRAQLDDYLARLAPRSSVRAGVATVLGYLEPGRKTTDLLAGPVFVSPAESLRGRANALLAKLARSGPAFAPLLLSRIAPMAADDQRQIRIAAGRIAYGLPVEPLWPDYLDREQAATWIREYARVTRLVEECIPGMEAALDRARGQVEALFDQQGMHDLEAARLAALVGDIENHTIDDRSLPPLLWLDEHSRHHADQARHTQRAAALGTDTAAAALGMLTQSRGAAPATGVAHAIRALGTDITGLARGQAAARAGYARHSDRLARVLAGQHLPATVHRELHDLFTTAARQAVAFAELAENRETAWTQRLATGPPAPPASSAGLISMMRTKTAGRQQDSPRPAALPHIETDTGPAADVAAEP